MTGIFGNLQFPGFIHYSIYLFLWLQILLTFRFPESWIYKSLLTLVLMISILTDFNKFHPLQIHIFIFLFLPNDISKRELGINVRTILGVTILCIAINQINGDYFLPAEWVLTGSGASMWVVQGLSVAFIGIEIVIGLFLFFTPLIKPALISTTILLVSITLYMLFQKIFILNAMWFLWLSVLPVALLVNREEDDTEGVRYSKFLMPALLFTVCVLSVFGVINRVYSFNIFVKHKSAILLVDSDVLESVPDPYRSHVFYFNGDQDPYVDLDVLMVKEYNLLLFPSDQVILRSVSPLRNLPVKNEQLVLLIKNGPEMEIGKDIIGYFKTEFK